MQYKQDKVGVFVDAESIAGNGGYGMRFDVLREFAARDVVGQPLMLNAYVDPPDPTDSERVSNAANFAATLREFGYRVVEVRDREGPVEEINSDVWKRSERLDTVVLATAGDEDTLELARDLVRRGHRVEIVGFNGVAPELAKAGDLFMSGHLIANLLPARGGEGAWGEEGSRVRGVCYSFSHDRGFGFIRYMHEFGDLTLVDTRDEVSPYRSAFCHESELPAGIGADELPSREFIFEFTLAESERGLQARDVTVVGG